MHTESSQAIYRTHLCLNAGVLQEHIATVFIRVVQRQHSVKGPHDLVD